MTRLRFACMVAACAAVMVAGSPRASAESVSLQFDKSVNPAVSLSGSSTGPYTSTGPFYWHDSGLPANTNFPPPTATFCIDVNGSLPSVGGSAVFGVTSVDGFLGAAKASAITELYGKFYDTAWDSSSFTGSTASIAFQLAMWELAIDGKPAAGNTTDLQNGTFTASPLIGSTVTTAQAWLNGLNGNTSLFNSRFANRELVALYTPVPPKNQLWQNQITLRPKAVPAPPGIVLAGIGFLGLLGRARLMRRKIAV